MSNRKTTVIDKNLKRRWLRALRSGKYEQGTGNLCSISREGETTYCCLGVLCDLVDKKAWNTTSVKQKFEPEEILEWGDSSKSVKFRKRWESIPPTELTRAVGLTKKI